MEKQAPAWMRREDLFLVPPGGWILCATLILGIALAGAGPVWAQGVVAAGVALLWLVNPPARLPAPPVLWVLAALALVPLAAYWPTAWSGEPVWREHLGSLAAIPSSPFITPQPWLTFQVWLLWLTGVALAGWCASQEWDHYNRDTLARIYTCTLAGLTVFALFAFWTGNNPAMWKSQHGFGPFINRNQWGSVLGTGGIVAIALIHQSIRHMNKRGFIFWSACLALMVLAIMLNGSRGGMAVLMTGGFLYWMFFGVARRQYRYAGIAVSFLCIAFSLFAFSGGPLLERFVDIRDTVASGGDADFRIQFYRMTRAMLADSPLAGFGLGNFEFVLPFYLNFERVMDRRPIHPESSFLWLACEGGWLAVAVVGAAFAMVVKLGYDARRSRAATIRSAGLACAMVIVFNAFFEVSGHRIGSLFPAIMLASLALPPAQGHPVGRTALRILRAVAVLGLAVAFLWMCEPAGGPVVPAVQGVTALRDAAGKAKDEGRIDEGVALLERAAHYRPLDWSIYWSMAAFNLENGNPDTAWDEFRAAGALLPYMHWIIDKEGYFWVPTSPARALHAWMEAMRRAQPSRRISLYAGYLNAAKGNPPLRALLNRVQPDDPEYEFARINADGDGGVKRLKAFLARTKDLALVPDHIVEPVIIYMAQHGQGADLDRMASQSPRVRRLGWRILADRAAAQNRLDEALELNLQHGPKPILPAPISSSDLRSIERAAALAPMDIATSIAYYQALEGARRKDDAFFQLRRIMEKPDAPAYIWYLAAERAHERGENDEAWQFLTTYRQKTRQ